MDTTPIPVSEKLRRFLKAFNISQREADERTGRSIGYTYSILKGRTGKFHVDYFQALVAGTPVSIDWFRDGNDDQPNSPSLVNSGTIPIAGDIPASSEASLKQVGSVARGRVAGHESARYYRVADSSMVPLLAKGDLLLISPVTESRHGGIALVKRDSGEIDIRETKRVAGGKFEAWAISDSQDNLIDGWSQIGLVISRRRVYSGNFHIDTESDSGITREMLIL